MSHKTLITVVVALFATSSLFLFWQNARELDPDREKDWWVIAFAVPQEPSDLSFLLENHSDQTEFQYEIVVNKETRAEKSFTVAKGRSVTITPDMSAKSDTRTSIVVTDGKEKKEIYR